MNPCNCKPGSDCLACDNINSMELSHWDRLGAAIVIVVMSLLSLAIIAGGSTWLYGTLGAL